MFQVLVEFQCTIYLALAEQIKLLAAGGGWLVLRRSRAREDAIAVGNSAHRV